VLFAVELTVAYFSYSSVLYSGELGYLFFFSFSSFTSSLTHLLSFLLSFVFCSYFFFFVFCLLLREIPQWHIYTYSAHYSFPGSKLRHFLLFIFYTVLVLSLLLSFSPFVFFSFSTVGAHLLMFFSRFFTLFGPCPLFSRIVCFLTLCLEVLTTVV